MTPIEKLESEMMEIQQASQLKLESDIFKATGKPVESDWGNAPEEKIRIVYDLNKASKEKVSQDVAALYKSFRYNFWTPENPDNTLPVCDIPLEREIEWAKDNSDGTVKGGLIHLIKVYYRQTVSERNCRIELNDGVEIVFITDFYLDFEILIKLVSDFINGRVVNPDMDEFKQIGVHNVRFFIKV